MTCHIVVVTFAGCQIPTWSVFHPSLSTKWEQKIRWKSSRYRERDHLAITVTGKKRCKLQEMNLLPVKISLDSEQQGQIRTMPPTIPFSQAQLHFALNSTC